jgi:hypothetical protein
VRVGSLDDVHYDLEVDGEEVRRTLHRKVFERGAWATVAVAYVERDKDGDWKAPKLALVRLQKVYAGDDEGWKSHGTVTLDFGDAQALASAIQSWAV